ncbi:RES family NAD+ phosphorylase [Sinanaerobacter chloroacetimidivorans]|uniref:RES family NAD+ phosphorylase n=1 Tax=Sinanaerobacter chloroacetimidivorans TaxID=2818044 RepID=A0A8J7W3E8_9FIRM|nr:RES family NAD+ phosphorylase [Sinanaerobacter chloroacetimidivorans]MBR0599779.1 RES family NAD+ phosphorylase [Sinanaerobacter chloroacetimidivorans]
MIKYSERDFSKLYRSIMTENRYIFSAEILEIIKKINDFFVNRVEVVPVGSIMYRAQKGVAGFDDLPIPYGRDRMLPLDHKAREGRANPKGIPYIYLSNKEYIAISEVRSWNGDQVSLASFTNKRELRLIDFSSDDTPNLVINFNISEMVSDNSIETLWGDINQSFSRPVTSNDDAAEYALTQMIAECVKNSGYDGLFYNSYFSKDNKEGKNIVIFDKNLLKLHKVTVYEIEGIDVRFNECTNPHFYKD